MLRDDFELARPLGRGGSAAGGGGSAATGGDGGDGSDGCAGGAGCGSGSTDGDGAPDSGAARCGIGGEVGPNGDCYTAGVAETTWLEARQSCLDRGAGWDLATIRDAEENAFVLAITGFEAWIGATDQANEGTWLWVRDDAPFFDVNGLGDQGVESYTNWNTDEPNDASDSDCLRILTTGLWADWQCGSVKGYVCQQTAP